MKVEENLVPGLSLMKVIEGQVEVVGSDGTLRTLVHNKKNRGEGILKK